MRCEELNPFEASAPEARAHLAGCAACADAVGALALARAALDEACPRQATEERAAALRERVLAWVQEKPAPGPAAEPASDPRVRLRCTWCHDGLAGPEPVVYCAACLAPAHAGCFRAQARCAAPGCGGTLVVSPRALGSSPAPARRLAGWWVATLAGAAALTGAALSFVPPRAVSSAPPSSAPPVAPSPPAPGRAPAPPAPVAAPPSPAAESPAAESPAAESPAAESPAVEPPEPAALAPAAPDPAGVTRRVLFVEGDPRWEYRYLKSALLRRPDLAVQCLLDSADPDFEQEHSPGLPPLGELPTGEALDGYDLLILGDLDLRAPGRREWLVEVERAVLGGAGLLVIAGPRQDWGESGLGELLPVQPAGPFLAAGEAGLRPARTSEGRRTLALTPDATADERLWASELPPLSGRYPAATRDDACVLLETPERAPLLALSAAGRGTIAWLGLDDLWRWRSARDGERLFARLYERLLELIARPSPDQLIELRRPWATGWRRASLVRAGDDPLPVQLERLQVQEGRVTLRLVGERQVSLQAGESLLLGPGVAPVDSRQVQVAVAGGGCFLGALERGSTGVLQLRTRSLGALRLPWERTAWVAFDGLAPPEPLEPIDQDRVCLRNGARIDGVLEQLSASQVAIVGPLGRVQLGIERVAWVRFAEQASGTAAPVDPRAPTVDVRLRDGSWLRTRLTDASRDELQLLIPWFTGTPRALSVPLRRVAQLTVR